MLSKTFCDDHEGELFEGVDFSSDVLKDISFYKCEFLRSSFQFSEVVNCEFKKCKFTNCNLSLAKLNNTKIIDTEFVDSKLLGINWSDVGVVIIAAYRNCILDSSSFNDMNLTKVGFSGCSLVESVFSNVKLQRVKFDECDLSGCQFHNSDLSHSDFSTAKNYFISADSNKLHQAIFSLPEAASLLANLDIKLK